MRARTLLRVLSMGCTRVGLLAVLGLLACGPGPEDGGLPYTDEELAASSEAGLLLERTALPPPPLPPPPPSEPQTPYRTQPDPECGEDCPGLPQDPIPLTILRPSVHPRFPLIQPVP